jgi:malate dehydrogenase (oxaloacetate-decarboxylating)(NADP+)
LLVSAQGTRPDPPYTWSKGKASMPPVPGRAVWGTDLPSGQANNFYVYPAIGLATYLARPKRLTDECFIVAAQATADQVDPDPRAKGRLYPAQSSILETEVTTATRIAEYMFERGLALVKRPKDVRSWIEGQLYVPRYRENGR